ncbi:MAG: iron-sulfur cluster assembly accessory protein [SAR324 cluster bacterium]|nr:iron-sulfur cluster assembly accessory protein [SAR324 cluster bacterium]
MTQASEAKLILTEKAAKVFKDACLEEGNPIEDSFLRVGANPGGCSGYRYELGWNSSQDVQETDLKFVSNGVNIVVDKICLTEILGSVEIDYTDSNMVEQGFVFKQLRNGSQCGCGESFTPVKEL